jgi:hypothetical protein
MNPTTHRMTYPGTLPMLDLSTNPKPSWQPYTLDDSKMNIPSDVANLIKDVRWDWIFDLACNLAGQFRTLGMSCGMGSSPKEPTSAIMVDDPRSLSAEATAHAWVLSMVQRTAVEIRQMQLIDEPRQLPPANVMEISGIAYIASSSNSRGTGRRLTKALRQVSRDLAERCDACGVVPGTANVQFMHARPVQLLSPVVDNMAVPVAAYRLRFSEMTTVDVMNSLREALSMLQECDESPMRKGDVLVLSSLWAG